MIDHQHPPTNSYQRPPDLTIADLHPRFRPASDGPQQRLPAQPGSLAEVMGNGPVVIGGIEKL